MKRLKAVLLVGTFAVLVCSAARAADQGDADPGKPNHGSADRGKTDQGGSEADEGETGENEADQGKRDRGKPEPITEVDAESASHKEVDPLQIEFGRLSALRLHTDGNLLACDAEANQIKVICPEGKQVDTIKLEFAPEAIDVAADGTIYCGGQGQLAKLDRHGRLLKTAELPKKEDPPAGEKRRGSSRKNRVSGIAVSGRDLFVAYGAGWSLRSKSMLFRFSVELDDRQLIAKDLRGCCQRCDIVARDGVAYVAENARYQVVSYNRSGEVLGRWGGKNRKGLEGFGACCNPMNLCFDARGVLYTAESGLGRVKRYSTGGKFLSLVGYVGVDRFSRAGGFAASCSNIAIAVTPDGKRVYVMDYKNNCIRVLQQKS